MDRPRFYRGLRIAVSAASGILFVLLVVLWVRSYWWMESIDGGYGRTQNLHVTSLRGRIGVSSFNSGARIWDAWGIRTTAVLTGTKAEYEDGRGNPLRSIFGFQWSTLAQLQRHPSDFNLVVPYWFPAAVMCALGAALSTSPPYRFSLRTLLIATTLIAVVLGLVVFFVR